VAFIVDVYSRMNVEWQASRSLRTGLAIDAGDGDLQPGPHRQPRNLSLRYSQRLDQNDIVASVGSKGDSHDNSLVESFNGLYKRELIYPRGPWMGLEDVEFSTLTYIDWFNQRRLHGGVTPGPGYTTPANHEADYYRQNVPTEPTGTQTPESL
jgi:putative transposase